jgi:hypothetical protein
MVKNFERLAILATACVLSAVTFSLSGCYAYPAVWSKCPHSQHLVVDGEFRCGEPEHPPTPAQVEMLKQRPLVGP